MVTDDARRALACSNPRKHTRAEPAVLASGARRHRETRRGHVSTAALVALPGARVHSVGDAGGRSILSAAVMERPAVFATIVHPARQPFSAVRCLPQISTVRTVEARLCCRG